MPINSIEPPAPVSQIAPLMQTMLAHNDQLPKNNLPTETLGTVQENAHFVPEVTLYNSHGILTKSNPNSLIAYA